AVDTGDLEKRLVCDRLPDLIDMRRFDLEVQLGPQVVGELTRQARDAELLRPCEARLGRPGQPSEYRKVPVYDPLQARTSDLDHALRAVLELGHMYLSDGGRPERGPRDGREDSARGASQLDAYLGLDRLASHGRYPRLQLRQLGQRGRGQQVGPGGQQLAELDEDATNLFAHEPRPPSQVGRVDLLQTAAAPERERRQPMPGQDPRDLHGPYEDRGGQDAPALAKLAAPAARHLAGATSAAEQQLEDDDRTHGADNAEREGYGLEFLVADRPEIGDVVHDEQHGSPVTYCDPREGCQQ